MPGDDIKIKAQVEEAEKTIEHEIAQFEEENPESNQQVPDADNNDPGSKTDEVPASETVGLANDLPESFPNTHGDTDKSPSPTPDAPLQSVELSDTSKDQGDDGGDIVLEGDEDTVIY